MVKSAYKRFAATLDVKPLGKATLRRYEDNLRSWATLHPVLRELNPDDASLRTLAQLMSVELMRDGGPRDQIMDRLYKRYSNLRREMETTVMADAMLELADT